MADVRSGLDPKDYRFLKDDADPGFSPERNKATIEETIKETNQFFKEQTMLRDKEWQNRKDILSSYGIYKFHNGGSKQLRQYVGEAQYKAIIGEKIMSKIRVAETVNRLNKNTKFMKGILL